MKQIQFCVKTFLLVVFGIIPVSLPVIAGGLPPAPPLVTGSTIAVVKTEYGKVRGYIHEGTYIYKGIPYARAGRFMPPEKPDSWKGIKNALAWGPICPQMVDRSVQNVEADFMMQPGWGYEAENCQVLNIWTPSIRSGGKRPVMVWIHGGGFVYGSSQHLPLYDGENLSKKGDIVLVSVNHRLNALGFADLSAFGEKYKYSANAGIMDLVAALKWIKQNIGRFGGDPGNITIFGQSGGGAKVGTLMAAPSAQGLFHKAIIQSGANPKFQSPTLTRRIGAALVRELGIEKERIDSIHQVPHVELIAAATRALNNVREELIRKGQPPMGFGFGFGPCLDGDFLPYPLKDEKTLSLSRDIPLLLGSTKTEFISSVWHNPPLVDADFESVNAVLKNMYGPKTVTYVAAFKKAYPADTRPSDLIDVDTRFRHATIAHANLKSAHSRIPVFVYLFSWNTPVLDGVYKSFHTAELPFVFNNINLAEQMTGGGADAHILAHKISLAWIHFARTGDPNNSSLPAWPSYTSQNGATMVLDNTCTVRYHHDRDLLKVTADNPPLW